MNDTTTRVAVPEAPTSGELPPIGAEAGERVSLVLTRGELHTIRALLMNDRRTWLQLISYVVYANKELSAGCNRRADEMMELADKLEAAVPLLQLETAVDNFQDVLKRHLREQFESLDAVRAALKSAAGFA